MLFLGIFAGAAYRHAGTDGGRDKGGQGAGTGGYATPYMQALPRQDRRALREAMRDAATDFGAASRKERRAFYQQMVSMLRTEPFDPAAVEQILASQRDAALGLQSAVQSAWLAQVGQMSAERRMTYADALEAQLARRGKRRDGGKKTNR